MSTTRALTGLVEVVSGPYRGCRGEVLDGAGQGGKYAYEAVRITEDPSGNFGADVIERFDPRILKEVDQDTLPIPTLGACA